MENAGLYEAASASGWFEDDDDDGRQLSIDHEYSHRVGFLKSQGSFSRTI